MHSANYKYRPREGSPKAPTKPTKALKWNVYAEEFVPATGGKPEVNLVAVAAESPQQHMPNQSYQPKGYKGHVAPQPHMRPIPQTSGPMMHPSSMTGPHAPMYAYVQRGAPFYPSHHYYHPNLAAQYGHYPYMPYPQVMQQTAPPAGPRFVLPHTSTASATPTRPAPRARVAVIIKRLGTDEPVTLPQTTIAAPALAPGVAAPTPAPKIETPKAKVTIVLKNPETGATIRFNAPEEKATTSTEVKPVAEEAKKEPKAAEKKTEPVAVNKHAEKMEEKTVEAPKPAPKAPQSSVKADAPKAAAKAAPIAIKVEIPVKDEAKPARVTEKAGADEEPVKSASTAKVTEEKEVKKQNAKLTASKPEPAAESAAGRRSESPVADKSAEASKSGEESGEKPKDGPTKLDTRPSMTRLESFDCIRYPDSAPPPPHKPGMPFRYQRDFLMQFAEFAKERPEGLPPHSDIYGDKKGGSSRGGARRDSKGPAGRHMLYQNSSTNARRTPFGASGGGHRYAPPEPPMKPVEALIKSESAWVPHSMKNTKGSDVEDAEKAEEDAIARKMNGLLNKLTIDRFESISDQIMNVGITRESILKVVIGQILEKAWNEPNFGSMYASLCSKLSSELPKIQTWTTLNAKNNAFRRALLGRCQEEFERGAKWSESEEKLTEQRREARSKLDTMTDDEKLKIAQEDYERGKLKRRVLGNIQFIGELFVKGLITEKTMHLSCIQPLLENVDNPEEEDVESLCKLLNTAGARIDHHRTKKHCDAYFERIETLANNNKLAARIRFMLLDLIHLRKDGWANRTTPTGPKTIAHVRAEAKKKAAEDNAKPLADRTNT